MIGTDRAHERGDRRKMRRWLAATIALGAAFFINQIVDYATLAFRYDDSPYGSIYWGLTGLHTFHVLCGVSALCLLYIRAVRTRSMDEITPWANGISLFWHLGDVVWVCVFVTIWVIR